MDTSLRDTNLSSDLSSDLSIEDTICAVATGTGRSAIAIIRVSGSRSIEIVDGIFAGKKRILEMESFTAAFGRIKDGEDIIDEAVVLVMRGPHTYTTEDTVEIDLHGGPVAVKCVTELLVKRGVRIAEPGEFTKRAFLGGRIDMTEAEAVMDVIDAATRSALDASVKQLSGALRDKIAELREKILYQTAYIESALDDPENYSLDGYGEKLEGELIAVRKEIDKLLSTADEGRIIREGIRTVIVGRPNVGKSSMLNRLLGEERAIVTDIEGTTRDTLEEYVDIGGVYLRLIDTAGIRETEDRVESIGVDRARAAIEDAELVLMLLDAGQGIVSEDLAIAESLGSKKVILLVNKIDIDESCDTSEVVSRLKTSGATDVKLLEVSARTGQGIDELKAMIREMFLSGMIGGEDVLMITRERHKEALLQAEESLDRVLESIALGMGEDFYTIDLMAAYASLGKIIGEELEDDLADKIFSEFCMGK